MRLLRSPTLALVPLLSVALAACVGEIAGTEAPTNTAAATLAGPDDVTVTFNEFTQTGQRVRSSGGVRFNDTGGGWLSWHDEARPLPGGMTIFINNFWVSEATATFDLPAGMVLKSLRVVSPGAPSTVKIVSPGNPDRVWTDIGTDYRTLSTVWRQAASRVSITVTSAGLFGAAEAMFDDIVYGPAVGGPPQVFDDPSDGVEWEPIDLATTRRLRDSFDWNDTTPLSEAPAHQVTVDGEMLNLPAIHYAIVYVRDANELRELEEIGVHHDLVPLFESEWPDVGTSLVLPFNGDLADSGGMFAFALMPAITYNALRAETLAGEDTFRAVILRDVPEEADAGDGTVSWEFILQNMGSWAPPRGELTDDGEVFPPIEDEANVADKRLGRFLRRALRRVRDFTRGSIDLIRRGLGAAATLVLPDTELYIETSLNDRTHAPLNRGWDQALDPTNPSAPRGFGERLTLRGVRVNVQGRLTVYPGKLDEHGRARIKVPRSIPVNVCFEADSPAASFERGLLRPVMHCWRTHTPRGSSDTISRAVGDTEFYVMAQLIDARDYAREVLDFTPPKATVQAGFVAETLTRGDAGDAYVPCLAATRAPVSVVEAYGAVLNIAGWTVGGILGIPGLDLGLAAEFVFATDIVMNDDTRKSRNTPVHEYGHFVFCTLLADTRAAAFDTVWSQVLAPSNLSNDAATPVKALNEGFADWFTSQVVGGTNYFVPPGSWGEKPPRNAMEIWSGHAFVGHLAPASGEGMEANYGGPPCGPRPCIDTGGLEPITRVVGTVATILHDAVDRDTCVGAPCRAEARNDGAIWDISVFPFTPAQPFALHHISDEAIDLAPAAVIEAVQLFAERVDPLSYDNFYGALRDTMRAHNYPDPEICKLFALHSFDGTCDSWPDGSTIRHQIDFRAQLVPPEPALTTPFGTVTLSNQGGASCTSNTAPGSCQVTEGGSITLTANPVTGFQFASWSGWCAFAGTTTPSITLSNTIGGQECIANFRRASFLVTTNVVGSGFVNPPTAIVPFNGSITLEAVRSSDHSFVGWSGGGPCVGNNPRLPIPAVTSDLNCTATFAPITYTVRGTWTGSGTVSPQTSTVRHGASAMLTATPTWGHHFVNWTGGAQCTGPNPLTISSVTSNVTCTANFAPNTYTVTASWTTGGSVSPSSVTVSLNGSTTLRATANSGYRFVGWTGSPQCTGPNPLPISPVTSNVSCTANFAPNTVTVSFAPSPSSGGTVTATNAPFLSCWGPSCTFAAGSSVTLTARPSSGYVFAGWTGCSTQSEPVLQRTNVQSSETCTATFVRYYRVTYSAESPATATADVRFGSACSGGVCYVIDGGGVNLSMSMNTSAHTYDGWTCTEAGTGRVQSGFGQFFSLIGVRNDWSCRGDVSPILW